MTWETLRNLIRDEWFILGLLLAWSLAGLTIICERVYSLWNLLPKAHELKDRVVAAIESGDLAKAGALCETSREPLAEVFERGLKMFKKHPHKTAEVVGTQRLSINTGLKRYLWALGTVGSSAPFVGLFGTVVGILKAFQMMAAAGTGGFKVVSQGIAAALVATAGGLFVAIYAIMAYNYFVARTNATAMQFRLFCEEFLLALSEHGPVRPGDGHGTVSEQPRPRDDKPHLATSAETPAAKAAVSSTP